MHYWYGDATGSHRTFAAQDLDAHVVTENDDFHWVYTSSDVGSISLA